MNKARGFTVTELLIVILIVAILAVVGVSSFKTIRSSSSIGGEVQAVQSDLQYARAEALREGQPVTVCVSTTGSSCTSGTAWNNGWIVFSDVNGNGAVDSGDVVLRWQKTFTTTDTLSADNSTTSFIFNRLGFVNNITATVVTLTGHASTPATASTQCLAVNTVGQLSLVSAGQGNCS